MLFFRVLFCRGVLVVNTRNNGVRGWDVVCSPKMQWWTVFALADLYAINRPHTQKLAGTMLCLVQEHLRVFSSLACRVDTAASSAGARALGRRRRTHCGRYQWVTLSLFRPQGVNREFGVDEQPVETRLILYAYMRVDDCETLHRIYSPDTP